MERQYTRIDFVRQALDKDLKEIDFKVHLLTDSMTGREVTFTLQNKKAPHHNGNIIGFDSSKDGNDIVWSKYYIYKIDKDNTRFYYYMPEIIYNKDGTPPSKITQLLIPKRYYRSWVKSLSLVGDNGEDWNDKIKEMSQLELLRTLMFGMI